MKPRCDSFSTLWAGLVLGALCATMPAKAQMAPAFALSFNGVNQYVNANVPALASNYTISAWVYLRAGGVDGSRLGVLSATSCGASIELMVHSTNTVPTDPQYLELGRCNAFGGEVSTQAVPIQQWAHLAVTVSTNLQVAYFVNGVAAGSWDATGRNLALGPEISLADNTVRKFDGLLDEVQIWSEARSLADIQAGMHQRPDVTNADLVAYWPFDEGLGISTTADATGHGHTGTLVRCPMWGASPVGWTPGLRLFGANPLTNECHTAFVEPGTAVCASPAGLVLRIFHALVLKADGTVVGWGSGGGSSMTNGAAAGSNVVAIAAGQYHSLALKADGTVVGWGNNNYGQANGAAAGSNVVAIAAGQYHSLALKADGAVVGWGTNDYGAINIPASATNVVAIAASDLHNLALKADGTVIGWGSNYYGQITIPASATTIVAIATSDLHSQALKADGTVVGWGNNDFGQLNAPTSATNVVAIAAGFRHSLALKADGTVVGWGNNDSGQINAPALATNVVAIAAGFDQSMVLRADGVIILWGYDQFVQNSAPVSATYLDLPVAVGGTLDVNSLGTYMLTYSTTTHVGAVDSAVRTVVVVDTIAPVVTLLGSNPLVMAVNTPLDDPGATASDVCAGDLTASILVTGAVNTNVIGIYTLKYSATDASGNTGTASRAVWVATVPALSDFSAFCLATNPVLGTRGAQFNASVNPNGLATAAFLQYELTAADSGNHAPVTFPAGFDGSNLVVLLDVLAPGYTYHWRIVASNRLGATVGPDQILDVPAIYARGDFNGNGVVEDFELDWVYQGYWQDHPTVITNALGPDRTHVQLNVENTLGWDLTVQATTNLATWTNLPSRAIPVFQFTDPDATGSSTRVYRLLAP